MTEEENQRGVAFCIGDILENYMGQIISLEEQLEASLAFNQHTKFSYASFGSELCLIDVQNEYWNVNEVNKKVDDIKRKLTSLILDFEELPAPISWEIEQDAIRHIRKNDREYLNIPNTQLADKLTHQIPVRSNLSHISMMLELNETETVFDRVKKLNQPKKNINIKQSTTKFRKIIIIDRLRFLWEVRRKETINSIPYEGSEFGEMVSEIFGVLDIKSDVRAAMDAWRKERLNT